MSRHNNPKRALREMRTGRDERGLDPVEKPAPAPVVSVNGLLPRKPKEAPRDPVTLAFQYWNSPKGQAEFVKDIPQPYRMMIEDAFAAGWRAAEREGARRKKPAE